MRLAVALILGSSLLACSDAPPPLGPPARDAGDDAGASDGDPSDSGETPDAGAPDTGPAGDAGIQDLCNPVAQTGCPQGQKCIIEAPAGMPGARCVVTGMARMLGEACTGADCAAGLACIRPTASSTAAECVKLCDYDNNTGCEAITGEFECNIRVRQSNWGACGELPPRCDVFTQVPCGPQQACQPFQRRSGNFELRCRNAGPHAEGEACSGSAADGCQRGLLCVRDPGTGDIRCRRYCDMNTDCAAPEMCTAALPNLGVMYCVP